MLLGYSKSTPVVLNRRYRGHMAIIGSDASKCSALVRKEILANMSRYSKFYIIADFLHYDDYKEFINNKNVQILGYADWNNEFIYKIVKECSCTDTIYVYIDDAVLMDFEQQDVSLRLVGQLQDYDIRVTYVFNEYDANKESCFKLCDQFLFTELCDDDMDSFPERYLDSDMRSYLVEPRECENSVRCVYRDLFLDTEFYVEVNVKHAFYDNIHFVSAEPIKKRFGHNVFSKDTVAQIGKKLQRMVATFC